MSVHTIAFTLNGKPRTVTVEPHRLLADLLRDELDLTGTKIGCSVGVCGACSVLVDGAVVSSCLLPAVYVDGAEVTTVEGLEGPSGELSPLQDAFIRRGGFQCGICTSGQLIAATALLKEKPSPTRDEIRAWMMGNLCRCTGYYKIIEAIELAAETAAEPA